MCKELGWPTLASRRTVNEAMAMSLSLSGHGLSYLTDLFKPVASSHMRMTRSASSGGIRLPQVKTEMGKKSFAHRGARRWNSFPPGARTGGAAAIHSYPLTYVYKWLLLTAWWSGTSKLIIRDYSILTLVMIMSVLFLFCCSCLICACLCPGCLAK